MSAAELLQQSGAGELPPSTTTTTTTIPTGTITQLPSVTRLVDAPPSLIAGLELGPVSIIIATLVVLLLSLITVGCNSIILAAFYRYKRLRTASNCLLVSLAVSDFGVGVFMPLGTYLELSDPELSSPGYPQQQQQHQQQQAGVCMVPYCILIALCSVSVLVTVAIAVDRLTSLAQPLRYKNIITHSSIEKYIAVFWIYATVVGFSPLIYVKFIDVAGSYSGSCRFNGVIMPPVRVFLFLAVWAPSALILLGCYMYVYLVARAHARAIYTVELSFRNQTQTLALPRYGQTLAVTVGAFFILWLPFQTCMLLDTFCGTNILSDCTIWLGLPILAHSGTNPWIYAFHHGEIRIAAGKIAEDVVAVFGVTPSRYGCSPARRGSNTNLELAEVNNSNEERRPPIEDCFAAKHQSIVYASRRGLELSSKCADISPENDADRASGSLKHLNVVEEDIHDLKKMLDPKYIIDRNHMIDSNHNIDKIRNLKYLLDPTFNKIRHLRRLNHKRHGGKNSSRYHESRFVSYQNLKTDGSLPRKVQLNNLNTMSEPMLSLESPVDSRLFNEAILHNSRIYRRKTSNLSSVSDSNIKDSVGSSEASLKIFPAGKNVVDDHRFSVHEIGHRQGFPDHHGVLLKNSIHHTQPMEHQHRRSFTWARARQRKNYADNSDSPSPTLDLRLFQQTSYASLPTPDGIRPSSRGSPKPPPFVRPLNITPNRLANLIYHPDTLKLEPQSGQDFATRLQQTRKNLELLKYSGSTNTLPGTLPGHTRLLEPSRLMDSLNVPTIHSEPPSPIDPLPLDSLQEEDSHKSTLDFALNESFINANPLIRPQPIQRHLRSQSPTRHSDPIIPSVLLNIEDYSDQPASNPHHHVWESPSPTRKHGTGSVSPAELSNLLLLHCNAEEKTNRFADTIFPEHDSTRFSSRRPSDSKWSESSRSQEILSNVSEHPRFPSSYSVNNFQSCESGSDLNDITSCLDPFMCSDALSSSLRESFFSAPSMPDSEDIFTSFETDEATPTEQLPPKTRSSVSSVSLVKRPCNPRQEVHLDLQSKSTESMFRDREQNERLCAILRLEPGMHRNRPRIRPMTNCCKDSRLAPLATPTPTDVCTPTFDITVVSDLKGETTGLGVRV